jgi:hypothetical protein
METIIVQQIHNSFKTASLSLTTLGENELLKSLGFENCKNVKNGYILEVESENRNSMVIEREKEFINILQKNFPDNYIITKNKLNTLLTDYNFVIKNSGQFLGEIPSKNIKELIKFNHKLDKITRTFGSGNCIGITLRDRPGVSFANSYSVVAPANYFDETIKPSIKDPIILLNCRMSGLSWYIIVTMWGKEELAININKN